MTRQQWHIEIVDWETMQAELQAIRARVFIDEQKVPQDEEWDHKDACAFHFLAYNPERHPIATARLLDNGQVGRMAVLKAYRGKGVGEALMQYLIDWAANQKLPPLFLHSQVHAIPFYERLGFITQGPEFMDAGIPHREMRR